MDAVADRDYIAEFLAGQPCSHALLSAGADLALWAREFGFVEFSDAFATGS